MLRETLRAVFLQVWFMVIALMIYGSFGFNYGLATVIASLLFMWVLQ